MNDGEKIKGLIASAVILVLLVLSYAVLQDTVLPGMEGYLQRRLHYERVISTKGLSLHKGMYWKEKR
jgi:hypothetical protein